MKKKSEKCKSLFKLFVAEPSVAVMLLLFFFLIASTSVVKAEDNKSFIDKSKLTLTGVYYYPEHWPEERWESDFRNMRRMGFEFTHFGEFAWARMEPKEGKYDFSWLDRAVELAAKNGLKVIMCTSTATPPVWLVRKHPEILITNENGTRLEHGARQHASFASEIYRKYAARMIRKLAEHYGNDDRIMGWQLDNEPAVQFDYGRDAEKGFVKFLRNRYKTIDSLNYAWGTAFWSQTYGKFEEIKLPRPSQIFMNPHQLLDYRRYAAHCTASFLDMQSRIIKKYAVNQWVTTNYIPNYDEGHIGQSHELDFLTYTRYMVYGDNEGIGARGYRTGNPLRIAMANDFFRPISPLYGVMELQPGQVNWGSVNPQPAPGAVRLWLWHVFAGGSNMVCAYRYRQPLFGTEQYHYGMVAADGVTLQPGAAEYSRFIKEIDTLRAMHLPSASEIPAEVRARRAAVMFHHESCWNIDRQKQNSGWSTMWHVSKYYNALKSFGAPVDIVPPGTDLRDYPFVVVPAMQLADSSVIEQLKEYAVSGGTLVISCRTAQKTMSGRFPETTLGGMADELRGASIEFFDALMPYNPAQIRMRDKDYQWTSWGEILVPEDGTEVLAEYTTEFYKGRAAVTSHRLGKGRVIYVGVDSRDGSLEYDVLKMAYNDAGVEIDNLPYGITVEYRNGLGIVMNYMDRPYEFNLKADDKIIIGNKVIQPADVLVFKVGK